MSRGPRNPADLKKHGNCKTCQVPLFGYEPIKRELCGDCMASLYAHGLSLREISQRAGISMQRVHQMLINAGVEMRPKSKGMKASPQARRAL